MINVCHTFIGCSLKKHLFYSSTCLMKWLALGIMHSSDISTGIVKKPNLLDGLTNKVFASPNIFLLIIFKRKSLTLPTSQILLFFLIVALFLGWMNKEHWECRPKVFNPSRFTEGLKATPAVLLKQGSTYIGQY